MKKLPSYDSLKSTLYKFRNRSTRAGTSKDESPDYLSDESEEEKVRIQAKLGLLN